MSPESNTFFSRLKAACADDWDAYCRHDFVNRIGEGTLPAACFKHYLLQDYLFLIHFSRAHALAVYKAENLADMTAAATALYATINTEMSLHVAFCRGWGLTPQDMEAVEEAPANMAYTRYVLERGMAGDLLDLHVALLPCTVGYSEIGTRLRSEMTGDDNPYAAWIEMYSGDEYLQAVQGAVDQLERLAYHVGAHRFDALCRTFRQATRLEIGFWDMGMNPPDDLPGA